MKTNSRHITGSLSKIFAAPQSLYGLVAIAAFGSTLGAAACQSSPAADNSAGGDSSVTGGAPSALGGTSATGGTTDGGQGGQAGETSTRDDGVIATLTRACTPTECLSYLNLYRSVEELAAEDKIDKSRSIEVPYSQGRVYGGSIYLFSRGEQPTVTRYSVDSELKVKEEETVSFANTGTTVFCEICNVFGSKDLAFHIDATSGTLVSWNPTAMKVVKVSEIPESIVGRLPDGYADILFPRVFEGRAFYNAGWSDAYGPEVVDVAAVVAFDVTDDAPELDVIEDDRCGGTWAMAPFSDETGNVYAMGDYNAGFYQAGVLEPVSKPACLLRIKPGASEFDPDYYVDLLDTLDAKAVRNAFAMADGNLLMSILPKGAEGASTEEITEDPWAYYSIDEFRFVILDLDSLNVTPVPALGETAAGSATALSIDSRSFVQIYNKDLGADLYEVKTDGTANKIVSTGPDSDFDMIGRVR